MQSDLLLLVFHQEALRCLHAALLAQLRAMLGVGPGQGAGCFGTAPIH